MNTRNVSAATIKLNLPGGILRNAKVESNRIGISLQDFIRMLMATYFANANSIRAVSRDQALYSAALKEIETHDYTKVATKHELNNYLDKLDN